MDIVLRGRLNGAQRNRLKSLFDMMYSARELAEEIGINVEQVYNVYVPLGCPCEKDASRRLSINGKSFAEWYSKFYVKIRLQPNETFCKTCRRAVEIYKPVERRKKNLVYVLSICPDCGRVLTKILSERRGESDK